MQKPLPHLQTELPLLTGARVERSSVHREVASDAQCRGLLQRQVQHQLQSVFGQRVVLRARRGAAVVEVHQASLRAQTLQDSSHQQAGARLVKQHVRSSMHVGVSQKEGDGVQPQATAKRSIGSQWDVVISSNVENTHRIFWTPRTAYISHKVLVFGLKMVTSSMCLERKEKSMKIQSQTNRRVTELLLLLLLEVLGLRKSSFLLKAAAVLHQLANNLLRKVMLEISGLEAEKNNRANSRLPSCHLLGAEKYQLESSSGCQGWQTGGGYPWRSAPICHPMSNELKSEETRR